MSFKKKYKNKSVYKKLSRFNISSIFTGIKAILVNFKNFAHAKFTIMLVPHTDKKLLSFKISNFFLIFVSLLLLAIICSFIFSGIMFSVSSKDARENRTQLSMVEQHNRNYYQVIEEFNKPYKSFESALNNILESSLPPKMTSDSLKHGDYLDISIVEETKEGQTPLTSVLQDATENIEIYTKALLEQAEQKSRINELLKIIPAKWPIQNNQGRITAHFGPAPHPILGGWYLHTGIDIAHERGTPLIATAHGRIVEQQFNRDYGNYVIIRHEYGFYTKYAHMDASYVSVGDYVTQGQTVGTLGSTGMSTGPHIHYEIMINSQNIDPYKYINLLTK